MTIEESPRDQKGFKRVKIDMEILRNIGLKEATRKGLKGNLKGKVKCHIVTE